MAGLMAGEGIGSFALGPLQGLVTLAHIYLFAALLAVRFILMIMSFWGEV